MNCNKIDYNVFIAQELKISATNDNPSTSVNIVQ